MLGVPGIHPVVPCFRVETRTTRTARRGAKPPRFRVSPSVRRNLEISFPETHLPLPSSSSSSSPFRLVSLQPRVRGTYARGPPLSMQSRVRRICLPVFRVSERERNFFFPPSSPFFFIAHTQPCVTLRIPFGSRSPKRLSYLFVTWILFYLLSLPPLLLHLPNKFTSECMYTIIAARTSRW